MDFSLPILAKRRYVFFLLSVTSIAIRLPFFFRDYIDRDESTFILMGQAWVDGYLPYTHLWDVKPPLTFLFYAIVIYFFGKSFFALRLIGALMIAGTAFFTYSITNRFSNARAAIFAGIACVFLQSMFGSIQGVMSEHILMFFYMAALYFLTENWSRKNLIIAGSLIGIGLMVKISIAFPVLLLGLYLIYCFFKEGRIPGLIANTLYLTVPALLVVLLTMLPYFLTDQVRIWWDSVVLAPLAYTEAGRTNPLKILGLCLAVLAIIYLGVRIKRLRLDDPRLILIHLSVIGMMLSFLKGGRLNSHYLIQLYPPLLILVALMIAPVFTRLKRNALPFIIGLTLLLPAESYLEYYRIVQNRLERGTFYNGEGFTVPRYIRDQNLNTDRILFLEYHIGYWVLDAYPPSKTSTHPSNICKSEMFPYYNPERETAMQELSYLMEELRPVTVVTRSERKVFDRLLIQENTYIDSILQSDYTLHGRVDNADVYLRSK